MRKNAEVHYPSSFGTGSEPFGAVAFSYEDGRVAAYVNYPQRLSSGLDLPTMWGEAPGDSTDMEGHFSALKSALQEVYPSVNEVTGANYFEGVLGEYGQKTGVVELFNGKSLVRVADETLQAGLVKGFEVYLGAMMR